MTMMMVCDAGWVSKRGQLLFYVHFVRERVKRYYGIWNKVTNYWEEIDLCVCVCILYVYTGKDRRKAKKKNPTHVYLYLRRGNVFFLVCLIFCIISKDSYTLNFQNLSMMNHIE